MPEGLDRTLLASAPLVVTLAQVRFEELAELADASVASALRELMAAHGMTSATQIHVQQVMFGTSDSGAEAESSAKIAAGWQFKSPGDAVVVTVLRDQVSLEMKKYPGWDSFVEVWRACVDGVLHVVKPALVTRLGLRYVNRVESHRVTEAGGWAELGLVDPSFLGPAVGSALSPYVTGAEGRVAMSFGDDVEAIVQYGVVSQADGPVFMLDIDCFTNRADEFSVDSLSRGLQALNDRSLEVFQGVVKEELRAEMLGPKGEVR